MKAAMKFAVFALLAVAAVAQDSTDGAPELKPKDEWGRQPVDEYDADIQFYPNPETVKAAKAEADGKPNPIHSVRSGDGRVVLHPVEEVGYNASGVYHGSGRRGDKKSPPCCRICPTPMLKTVRYNKCYSVCGSQCRVPSAEKPCRAGVDADCTGTGVTGQDMVGGWEELKSTVDMPSISKPDSKNDRPPVGGTVETVGAEKDGKLVLHDPIVASPKKASETEEAGPTTPKEAVAKIIKAIKGAAGGVIAVPENGKPTVKAAKAAFRATAFKMAKKH